MSRLATFQSRAAPNAAQPAVTDGSGYHGWRLDANRSPQNTNCIELARHPLPFLLNEATAHGESKPSALDRVRRCTQPHLRSWATLYWRRREPEDPYGTEAPSARQAFAPEEPPAHSYSACQGWWGVASSVREQGAHCGIFWEPEGEAAHCTRRDRVVARIRRQEHRKTTEPARFACQGCAKLQKGSAEGQTSPRCSVPTHSMTKIRRSASMNPSRTTAPDLHSECRSAEPAPNNLQKTRTPHRKQPCSLRQAPTRPRDHSLSVPRPRTRTRNGLTCLMPFTQLWRRACVIGWHTLTLMTRRGVLLR